MIEQTPSVQSFDDTWPELPFKEWGDTCATLHLWTQIVGKVRLACTPWTNHSWHVPLYVTARGLTSSLIPHGRGAFQIDFDFVEHELRVSTNSGGGRAARLALEPRTVAYNLMRQFRGKLQYYPILLLFLTVDYILQFYQILKLNRF